MLRVDDMALNATVDFSGVDSSTGAMSHLATGVSLCATEAQQNECSAIPRAGGRRSIDGSSILALPKPETGGRFLVEWRPMPSEPQPSRRLEFAGAFVVLLGSFLLFWVQPLYGQRLLPWFGGGATVWSACLLFFQTALFLGYAYAYASERLRSNRMRQALHLGLLAVACMALVASMDATWASTTKSAPLGQILAALTVSIGLPFIALASTGPLVQNWQAELRPARSPYRLYALSNAGALLALGGYLLVLDPWLTLRQQSIAWLGGFFMFAALFAWLAVVVARRRSQAAHAPVAPAGDTHDPHEPPTRLQRMAWLALPAGSSLLLLATTNHLCQDLASSPFLWVVPLALFLLSFVIAFDHPRWYRRGAAGVLTLIALYLSVGVDHAQSWATARWLNELRGWAFDAQLKSWRPVVSMPWRVVAHCAALFAACFVLHGELYRSRPAPRWLTSYYLTIALGGALGGAFVSFFAPLVFSTYLEWPIGLVGAFAVAATAAFVVARSGSPRPNRRPSLTGLLRAAGAILAGLAFLEMGGIILSDAHRSQLVLRRSRNFYGMLAVVEPRNAEPAIRERTLVHGATIHGSQFLALDKQDWPTTYYSEASGAGRVLTLLKDQPQLHVGVVGMGVGTLVTYARDGDRYRFYEINPAVVEIAENGFTYLARAEARGAETSIVLGDARRSMERELTADRPKFDVLALDAFSSDAIPAHLLTKEAFDVYFGLLADDGTIAAHVSNLSLDLAAVVSRIAAEFDVEPLLMGSEAYALRGAARSKWVVLARDPHVRDSLRPFASAPEESSPRRVPLWTDDHHSLWPLVRW